MYIFNIWIMHVSFGPFVGKKACFFRDSAHRMLLSGLSNSYTWMIKSETCFLQIFRVKKPYTERAERVFHFLPPLHMNETFQLNCYLDDGRRNGDRPTWQLPANRVSEAVTNKSTFHSTSINIRSWSWQETLLPTFEKCDRIQDDFKLGTF